MDKRTAIRAMDEDTNETHRYTVTCDGEQYIVDAVDAYDAEGRATKLYYDTHGWYNARKVSVRMTPNAKLPGETALVDEIDEQAARLLKAIETMCAELRAGRANEALITGIMALGEHRARLVSHNAPSHIAALWENDVEGQDG